MAGVTTVVHCAAWPGPSAIPPPAVEAAGTAVPPSIGLESTSPTVLLRDNIASVSAVCDAAIEANAQRVVFSSSAFAYGYSHAVRGPQSFQPHYLPIDEAHPPLPCETYGLSKLLGEQVLEAAGRTASATSFVSLRFTNIIKRELWHTLPWSAPTEASPLTLLMWAYCHEDDVIDAHVQAVLRPEAAAAGSHEAYILAAPDTRFEAPTLPLLASQLGLDSLPEAAPMAGNASPLDARKAVRRLGFRPRSWQDVEGESRGGAQAAAAVSSRPHGSPSAVRALADPALEVMDLSGFALQSGDVLPSGARLAYRRYGPPVGEGKGVILHPTSFDAVHDELAYNIGADAALDAAAYTVLVPNLLGNGVSSSPSNLCAADGAPPFPKLVSIADNVRAQHAMLSTLGVALSGASSTDASRALALVYGYSMGALQAFEWAVAYPEAVPRIAAVCGASRCGELNAVFLRSLEAALTADACYDPRSGTFDGRPLRGLEAFSTIYAGWGVGEGWYVERDYTSAGFSTADEFVSRSYLPAFAQCSPSDLLSQVRTWRAADVAHHTAGDWQAAIDRIQGRVLLMPCDSDKYFTHAEAEREASALGDRCSLVPIRSTAGHRAGDPSRAELSAERGFLTQTVRVFLDGGLD